jgi:flagellar biosynthesis/type III secretory pathway M-ring protein FliF/YscJ
MGQETALMWFLALVFVILVIAVIVFLVALARSKRRVGGLAPDGAGIHEEQQPIAERLGEEHPGQYGEDPRGDDIGGNFSTIPTEERATQTRSGKNAGEERI